MKKLKITLVWQIFIALILGILFGLSLHNQGELRDWILASVLSPAGDIFIRMIKMVVVPIVITTLVVGIAKIGDTDKLGSIGFKTILYFEIITTIAIILGIIFANTFHPGKGIDMSVLSSLGDASKHKQITFESIRLDGQDVLKIILSIIPINIFASMANGEIMSIVFFTVMFGFGLSSLPERIRAPLINIFNATGETMFKVTQIVMRCAPVGVFALISVTIATFGFSSIFPLAKLVLLVYGAIVFFALVILGTVARLFQLRIWKLICFLKKELILAFSTASSESVLPHIIKKMELYGAPASITSFVISTGYSFNLDGSTLYQSIVAIFVAQLYGIELSLYQEIMLVLTLMITSKGIAGAQGVSFIVLLATLGSINIPIEGLAFIAGIDRFLDMARTALNVIGNALAVLVISKWENLYDNSQALKYEKKNLESPRNSG
ncbi:glutamate/aspartate:proton symporter GltP [Sodalis sp. CWE]|uniref:glutamate/aspartate:proton symporter GltP n=1 Tax=Sodalis sp. CWE TaxID=2803816 RepID=UPI001C7D5315|nr:glutamate/aspartate:proton symporter GltP [Sodalis sp. CWE]MBX4180767.1 glutamate/aspartate:proton symporter GltP [Sodalis sp. CWE]